EGETMSKKWTQLGKQRKPRDLIRALRKPPEPHDELSDSDEAVYERDSEKQAEIGKNYHDGIQDAGISPDEDINERESAIEEALDSIISKVSPDDKAEMGKDVTDEEIIEILKVVSKGKAPGVNGLTYEFWKVLLNRETQAKQAKIKNGEDPNEVFSIITVLRVLYNNILRHGVEAETEFTLGW
ncbi:hypothetical protein BDZ89DRAFT_882919, partial [Hymenopellis radicata]